MELWLDTADIAAIKKANELGIIYGVTTNPSIFAREKRSAKELIEDLLNSQPGVVALQVTRPGNVNEMVEQARQLSALSSRIVIKIPATPIGFAAMSQLKKHKVPVLATAISSLSQFVCAAAAGADYAALYLSHMQNAGKNIASEIDDMLAIAQKHKWSVKLMGAAFADAATAQKVMGSGIPSVTLPDAILTELLAVDPLVKKQIEQFDNDWKHYQENHDAGILLNKII